MLTLWSRQATRLCDGTSRRGFLQVGGLAFGGLTLGDILRLRASQPPAARPSGKSVILITLGGGPSHIDLYDLKPEAPAEFRGEFHPIPTAVPGFDICELFPLQARIADRLALLRSLRMSTSSHNGDQEVLGGFLYDRRIPGARGTPRPAFGSIVSRARPRLDMPAYVSLRREQANEQPLYLGPGHKPFVPTGPDLENLGLSASVTVDRLDDRRRLLQSLDGFRRDLDQRGDLAGADAFSLQALDVISSPAAKEAFDIAREPETMRQHYGFAGLPSYNANYYILSKFLLARRLVEAGVPVVTIEAFGEWDTHGDNFKTLRRLGPVVDRGVHALVTDLAARGLGDSVAVVMWGEFGRSPRITPYNNTPGRDHHGDANFALFAGGGLKMGQVVGATDDRAARPIDAPYSPQNVLATLYRVLGVDPSATFPDHFGRPMHILDDREPVRELVS